MTSPLLAGAFIILSLAQALPPDRAASVDEIFRPSSPNPQFNKFENQITKSRDHQITKSAISSGTLPLDPNEPDVVDARTQRRLVAARRDAQPHCLAGPWPGTRSPSIVASLLLGPFPHFFGH